MTVPHDPDAELVVVGTMLIGSDRLDAVLASGLGPDDFFTPAHGEICRAAKVLRGRGEAVDPVTVAAELRRNGLLDTVSVGLLARAETKGVAASSVPSYARIVTEMASQRKLHALVGEMLDLIDRPTEDAETLWARAERMVREARPSSPTTHSRSRAVDGAEFLSGSTADVPAIWGEGQNVAWASGESCSLVGPSGVGKTTLAQQLALARLGLRSHVLGMPVAPGSGKVLYIAADRPEQVRRSLARMVGPDEIDVLRDRLVIWRGPLPKDLAGDDPEFLRALAKEHGADTVILDSLKDVCLDLVEDGVGARLNRAIQLATAEAIEVLALHHQRKAQQGATKPRKLEDVYGSTWITAGSGSVLLLWGEPGDSLVELSHLKQPCEDVGPLRLRHDHHRGSTTVVDHVDAFTILGQSSAGLTARDLASQMFEAESPSASEIEKARRRLDGLVRDGLAFKQDGHKGGDQGGQPARYYRVVAERAS